MVKVTSFVRHPYIQQWLAELLGSLVDSGRRQRGISLYRANAIITFKETAQGFDAQVSGSQPYPYDVHGRMDDMSENGGLDIDDLYVSCSCPDDVVVCKHAVCALLHWAVLMDHRLMADRSDHEKPGKNTSYPEHFSWKVPKTTTSPGVEKSFPELEKQLQLLSEFIQASDHSLIHLNDAPFWPFKDKLPRVMSDLHALVKDKMTR